MGFIARRNMKRFCSSAITVVLLVFSITAFAQQSASSTLAGRVIDQSRAVIANATISARLKTTGAVRTTTSDGEGLFSIPQLLPGTYEVAVEASGFRRL